MEIAREDVDYCRYRADAIRSRGARVPSRDGGGKYGAAGTEGENGEKCHGAAVSEWLIENNGWQFIVAIAGRGGSTDAGDRILMRALHQGVQDARRAVRAEVIAQ